MKIASLMIVAAAFSFSTAHASEESEAKDYSAQVGVEAIARTVVEKNLVSAEGSEVLSLALESGRAKLGAMECDRALGTDICGFDVVIQGEDESSNGPTYHVQVRIRQGSVSSAELEKASK